MVAKAITRKKNSEIVNFFKFVEGKDDTVKEQEFNIQSIID